MMTGELKNRIDGLWNIFAAGGLVNPLDVIEQVTYLMFIRDLDDVDNLRAKECAMLGLPHKSIFADEVQVGDKVKKRVVINKLINSLLAFLVKTVILTDKSTILEFVQNLA